jgi:hypothetical protein
VTKRVASTVLAAVVALAPLMFLNRIEPWQLMCMQALGLFIGAKIAMAATVVFPTIGRACAFMLATLSMDPQPFIDLRRCTPPKVSEALLPALQFIAGALALCWLVPLVATDHPRAAGWTAMAAAVLILHHAFSDFSMLVLRFAGIAVKPIMRAPLLSPSLREFWGSRWNVAFRSLAHRLIFMPAAARFGTRAAAWVVFIVSGLVHELVITVPAGGGYGGPTVFFLIQAAALMLERRLSALRRPLVNRLWVLLIVIGPVWLLFPPVFIDRVIVPLFITLGAMS